MAEGSDTKQKKRILLVGATSGQVASLVNLMPEWTWLEAGAGWPTVEEDLPAQGPFDAVIVFAEKGREKHTLALCEAIRNRRSVIGVPLLVAVDQYELDLGNKVRRLANANFLLTPVEKEELTRKLAELEAGES